MAPGPALSRNWLAKTASRRLCCGNGRRGDDTTTEGSMLHKNLWVHYICRARLDIAIRYVHNTKLIWAKSVAR